MDELISRRVAIDELGYCQTYLFDSRDKDKKISLEDAEYAIEQLPYAQPEPCEDAVSRKELLKFFSNNGEGSWTYDTVSIGYIKALPSVTPKLNLVNKIDRLLEEYRASQLSVILKPEPCEDVVSRRKLLNDLRELITAWKKYPVMAEQIKGVETAIGYVEAIPSVTPKPEPCEDAVSRQDAIIQLSHNKNGDPDCDVIIQHDIETLKRLPSVTPKRKE